MKGSGINWEQARNRLRANERALEGVLELSPERAEPVYHQRALRLARKEAELEPIGGLMVLVLRLAEERYAIELGEVAEIVRFARCTPVPGAPPEFLGVINLHGELRSVLDLGELLVRTGVAAGDSGFVLALRRQGQKIGLRVDDIEELREFRSDAPEPPVPGSYLKGTSFEGLMLLDVDKVLAEVFSQKE